MSKLVRDKIPEIIEKDGKKAVVSFARKEEVESLLKEKIIEEATELKNSKEKEKELDEIVDILEITYFIAKMKGTDLKTLEKLRVKKAEERGSFDRGFILEKVE